MLKINWGWGQPIVWRNIRQGVLAFILLGLILVGANYANGAPAFDVCDQNTACLSWTHDGNDMDVDPIIIETWRIYWGYSAGNYSNTQDISGALFEYQLVMALSQPTEFFFALKAISDQGVLSDFSNEVNKTFTAVDFPIPSLPVLDVILGEFVPPPTNPTQGEIFDSDVVSNGAITFENRPALSRESARYELDVTLNSLGLQVGLFSKDEVGLADPGHTTLWVMPNGGLQLRHQNVGTEFNVLDTTALLSPGVTHKVVVDFDPNGMTLILDGVAQGTIPSWGMHRTTMGTVVGGACHQCAVGLGQPVLNPIVNGSVRLRVYP